MTAQTGTALPWPREAARPADDGSASLYVPGSNIVLDLHGDPSRAKLAVFSDGNHHMALEESLQRFAAANPEVIDIFYATTPPKVIIETLAAGCLDMGNLRISVAPHVFISPSDIIATLHADGHLSKTAPYKRSRGNTLLVRKGNPKGIGGLADLLRDDVRLTISNPVTEKASFSVYAATLTALADDAEKMQSKIDGVEVHSQVIHHREIPQILADDRADVAPVYYHLGLRYTRIFPDVFELVPLTPLEGEPGATAANITSTYDIGLVGDGGTWGAQLYEFLCHSPDVVDIYRSHGLDAAAS